MKCLLAAINAKYIHSNLGVYSLKAYADMKLAEYGLAPEIEIGEYTINQQMDTILQDIFKRRPDMVGFSCYIWNISYVQQLVENLGKVLPETHIWLGGPEVSYDAGKVLDAYPQVTGIMMGEGEEIFYRVISSYVNCGPDLKNRSQMLQDAWRDIPGVAFRDPGADGTVNAHQNICMAIMDMDAIPFVYKNLAGFENRIIYYESSRGCPFSCSYCLSSIDKRVRFRSLDLVFGELAYFLEQRISQVKFVDRTFNCKKSHAIAIWKYILDHDNGVTNFHFEISADLMDEEELRLIERMRPGLIQLEIGVQTTNPETIRAIRRTMDLKRLADVVHRVNGFGNIHQHLDLIAGLPHEDYESFGRSFDDVYAMAPEQLQLGFLKVLKGSHMEEMTGDYGLQYQSRPPYEVLSTKWLCYADVIRLKGIEDMVEVYYNSRQFVTAMERLLPVFGRPFAMYEALAVYYDRERLTGLSHSRLARYEILYEFIKEHVEATGLYGDILMYDLYLRENVKSRPGFAGDQGLYKREIRDFFIQEEKQPRHLTGYDGFDSRQMSKMAHIEGFRDGHYVLFDYRNRDPLSYNAKAVDVTAEIENIKRTYGQ